MLKCFARIASGLNVDPLVKAVTAKPHLFDEITARQTTPGSPHADTETIFLRWSKPLTVEAAFNELKAEDFPALKELPEAVHLLFDFFAHVQIKEVGRVILVSLKPGGIIMPHSDEGAYADHYERFHIPLKSEDGNVFKCGDETIHMEPGCLYWFNHKVEHCAGNFSLEPRLHLIIDAVAPAYRKERYVLSA